MRIFRPISLSPDDLTGNLFKYFGKRFPKKEGTFGVEFELEFPTYEGLDNYLKGVAGVPELTVIGDNSLRGHACETIFSAPYDFDRTLKVLEAYDELLKDFSDDDLSDRCSVHVHVNFTKETLNTFLRFVTVFYLVEEALVATLPEFRQGNLFCLRACDSDQVLDIVGELISRKRIPSEDFAKYCNLNLCALGRHGSLEIRSHPGTFSGKKVAKWVSILNELLTFAQRPEEAREILFEFSGLSPSVFMRKYLPLTLETISSGGLYWEEMLYNGVEYSQEIAYKIHVDPTKKKDVAKPKTRAEELLIEQLQAAIDLQNVEEIPVYDEVAVEEIPVYDEVSSENPAQEIRIRTRISPRYQFIYDTVYRPEED